MFYQNDVYVPTEYGTRECAEDREPCGAFYGIPFSGEIEEMATYDRKQIQEAMPERWFGKKDERILARMRGELPNEKPQVYLNKPRMKDPRKAKDEAERRRIELENDFLLNTNAPTDVQIRYREIVGAYVNGENKLLNKMLDLYNEWRL